MRAEDVTDRASLVAFVNELSLALRAAPQSSENPTVERYLEALSAWIDDMDGYFLNRGKPVPSEPTWALVAAMLDAARVYE